ncbi:MAG: MBL fold metallo-hydrolase [Chloroflexi bacterium AL-W]|nr:MBL fold metallo-hydrolase [Chloroflexi bacterium AL-N1]NOK68250.1 MBL fold metallo-hydrolase [Chloroflexi bacterium AL-N10]NOK73896.1 MBL fold metallo-hydrolase [Chloroflexi bacterium AL-N5]NOK82864.1 MBL fold metallo-hydrolase [Chloroflexi bacterium AL-W]NOK90386.1 MBL fold metallo-hydrolase [Chloroflexi bacterium AL-N15]
MTLEIKTITTPFIFNITVNCHLVKTDCGFILIDTAKTGKRKAIEKELARLGCKPGKLKLIVLTHGDFDHCGNAAYLRAKFGAKVAMHADDNGMVEQGNMFWNRKTPPFLVRTMMGLIFKLDKADQFKPDFTIQEGDNLSAYGFDAKVIELPGHSKGSIGLLTRDSDLFCGDLLANTDKPAIWSIIDDPVSAHISVDKLKGLSINTVYPGHGQPFPMHEFWEKNEASVVV